MDALDELLQKDKLVESQLATLNYMKKLSQRDVDRIQKLRAVFPPEILARTHRSEDGGFSAEVVTFPGCITEGDTFSELIEMINDAVRTYLEVPERYSPYTPSYLPSIEMAQQLDGFPVRKAEGELAMRLTEREGAQC